MRSVPIGTFLFASVELKELHERFSSHTERFFYFCNTSAASTNNKERQNVVVLKMEMTVGDL